MYVFVDGELERVPVATVSGRDGKEKGGGEREGERHTLLFNYTHNESEATVWPNGVPSDGSPLEELKHPLLELVVVCYMLSGTVILCAVVCLVFNICFRKKK